MIDNGVTQFETQPLRVGEHLLRADLSASERSRLQDTMKWSAHTVWVMDPTTPPMVALFQYCPQKIDEAATYYADMKQNFDYSKALKKIEEIAKMGKPKGRVKFNEQVEMEPLESNHAAVNAVVGSDSVKIAYSSDCDLKNIDIIAEICQSETEAVSLFGIAGYTKDHLLLVTSQYPILDSQFNPKNGVIQVGCRGINDFANSDILPTTAHEVTHEKYSTTLQREFSIDSRKFENYPWETLLQFIDEGVAVYAQQVITGTPAKKVLRENFESMHPVLKSHLMSGTYSETALFDYARELRAKGMEVTDPIFRADLHSRYLPGAFVEYCVSKGIKFQDIMRMLIDRFNLAKPDIAQPIGLKAEDVSYDIEQVIANVKSKIPQAENTDEAEQNKKDAELDRKVWQAMTRTRLRPFEVIAALQGSNETTTIGNFLKWLQES